jgi:hypothetical protein
MRVRAAVFVLLLSVGACTSAPAPAPTPAALQQRVDGTLNQVMRGILFPNSNVIFDAQDKNPAAEVNADDPTDAVHVFHSTYGGWEAVENASVALAEAANLVSMPGRTCANGKPVPLNDDVFQQGLTNLREVSMASLKAAQAKDMDAMLDISDKLTQACSTCHDVYRDKIVDGKPIGIADRCVK